MRITREPPARLAVLLIAALAAGFIACKAAGGAMLSHWSLLALYGLAAVVLTILLLKCLPFGCVGCTVGCLLGCVLGERLGTARLAAWLAAQANPKYPDVASYTRIFGLSGHDGPRIWWTVFVLCTLAGLAVDGMLFLLRRRQNRPAVQ